MLLSLIVTPRLRSDCSGDKRCLKMVLHPSSQQTGKHLAHGPHLILHINVSGENFFLQYRTET